MDEHCNNPDCNTILSRKEVKVCAGCNSTGYCSRDCQVAHWKVHKKVCKYLVKGNADQFKQQGNDEFIEKMDKDCLDYISWLVNFPKECQTLHRLFMETPEEEPEPRLNARVKLMKKTAKQLQIKAKHDDKTKHDVEEFVFRMVKIMVRLETWRIEKATSPLLILFELGLAHPSGTSQYHFLITLSQQSSPSKRLYNRNQVVLAKQFITHGADVNRKRGMYMDTPLDSSCYCFQPTNLEFIKLLLENGADRNHQCAGGTALMMSIPNAPSAAKLLITYEDKNCPPIDVNVTTNWGCNALNYVQFYIEKNIQYRDEVMRTGERAVGSSHHWTTVEPFNQLIDQLQEVNDLLIAKGGVAVEMSDSLRKMIIGTVDRLPRVVSDKKKPSKPLDFDISCLVGKDLLHDNSTPAWYQSLPFHVKDDMSRMHEVHTTKTHLRSDGGIKPEVGQLVKIFCSLPNKSCGFLCGKVIETLPVPSDADLKRSKRTSNPTYLYGLPCLAGVLGQCGHTFEEGCLFTKNGTRFELLSKYGAVHTQEVKCKVAVATNMLDGDDASFRAFFGFYSKFIVTLRFKDDMLHRWGMVRVEPWGG